MLVSRLEEIIKEIRNKEVYIFPFSESGKKLLTYLSDVGLSVEGFITDEKKYANTFYLGKKIVLDVLLEDKYVLCPSSETRDIASIKGKKYIIDCPENITCNFAANRKKDGSENIFLSPHMLNYLLRHVCRENKKIIFWGKREDICALSAKISCVGINVEYGISDDRFEGREGLVEFMNPFDLLYENESNIFVWVLYGSENDARRFVIESGINENIFCCTLLHKLHREIGFDPNMGFNNHYKGTKGIMRIGNIDGNEAKKIAVLGGSTSDSSLYIEKSWPEYLYDLAQQNRKKVQIINGAVSGYTASQELMKLIRDIIPLKPDVVISFSRINEAIGEEDNFFVHAYQKKLFERISFTYENEARDGSFMTPHVIYGKGVESHGQHWLNQEIMMKALCDAFGIEFICIVQPSFYEKTPMSKYDRELLEYIGEDKSGVTEILAEINELAQQFIKQNDWMKDFTKIFNSYDGEIYRDRCHVNAKGNEIIASKIYSLLVKEKII